MAFNAAKQSFSVAIFSAAALLTLFCLRHSAAPVPVGQPFAESMPIAAAITGFSATNPLWSGIIALMLLLWTLFIIAQITVRLAPASGRNYLSIPVFVIIACGIVFPDEAFVSCILALLLALSTQQFISSFRKGYHFTKAFRAGLYLGFMPLLYAPAILLLLLIPVISLVYRRSWREAAVSLIGAALPVTGAGFIYWATGDEAGFIYREIWQNAAGYAEWTLPFIIPDVIPVVMTVCAALSTALVVLSVIRFVSERKRMRTRQRKVMPHAILLLTVIVFSLLLPGTSSSAIPLMAVPAAIAVPYAFTGKYKIIASIIYFLLTTAVLALNLLFIFGIIIP